VEYKNKSDTSNNRSDWNHFKIIKKTPAQHTGKAEYQGTIKTAILGTAHILQEKLCKSTKCLSWGMALHVP
jgi:hypothetical protein